MKRKDVLIDVCLKNASSVHVQEDDDGTQTISFVFEPETPKKSRNARNDEEVDE